LKQVGPGVTAVQTGDRVAFARQQGAYAEAIVLEAERLIHLSDDISFEEAAAFPLQGMTAHYLIHDSTNLVRVMLYLFMPLPEALGFCWCNGQGTLAQQ